MAPIYQNKLLIKAGDQPFLVGLSANPDSQPKARDMAKVKFPPRSCCAKDYRRKSLTDGATEQQQQNFFYPASPTERSVFIGRGQLYAELTEALAWAIFSALFGAILFGSILYLMPTQLQTGLHSPIRQQRYSAQILPTTSYTLYFTPSSRT